MESVTVKFICDELAELFESPCNFSPIDERMAESGRCENDCPMNDNSECWRRYFIERYKYFSKRLQANNEGEQ